MRIRILDPHWKPDPGHFFKIYFFFFKQKIIFQIFCFSFSHIFILKLDEPFRNEEIFIISVYYKGSEFGFFLQFLVDILPLTDPDPGSQNLRDPTDTDPKHWF